MENFNSYYCPQCFGNINVADKIIFKLKSKNDEFGLVLLSAKINDYQSETSESIIKVEEELYKFYCPLCSKCLNLDFYDKRLIKIYMKDQNKKKYEIYFSGIFGEHCTFTVNECKLEYFGPYSQKCIDQLEKYREYFERHL